MTPEQDAILRDIQAHLKDVVEVQVGGVARPTLYELTADSNAWKAFVGLSPEQIEQAVRDALGDGFDISITPK